MQCTILRSLTFSRDGFTPEPAAAGGVADIPADLVAGLEAEGYVRRETKDAGPSPENKMEFAVENKRSERRGSRR